MSIRKRKWKKSDGTETTVCVADVTDPNGHRERRQFESRKEADAFHFATEGKMRMGVFRADSAKLTVKEAADEFVTYSDGRR